MKNIHINIQQKYTNIYLFTQLSNTVYTVFKKKNFNTYIQQQKKHTHLFRQLFFGQFTQYKQTFTWISCNNINILTCLDNCSSHSLQVIKKKCTWTYSNNINILTCFDNCSSHSLYRVKNFWARTILSMKPQEASLTRIMILGKVTIKTTLINCQLILHAKSGNKFHKINFILVSALKFLNIHTDIPHVIIFLRNVFYNFISLKFSSVFFLHSDFFERQSTILFYT